MKAAKYWLMVWEVARSEFKLRDQGTFLGFVWSLLNPMIYFIIMYNLFRSWMRSIGDFPLFLLIGIVQWNFFASATTASITTIVSHGGYIKNIKFPKSVLVMTSILSVLLSYAFELVILVSFAFVIKGRLGVQVIALLPLVALTVYLIAGFSFWLATIGVYFLDIGRIWGILMSVGMFLTPVFYAVHMITPSRRIILLANPMTHVITGTRDILIGGIWPAPGGLAYVAAVATLLFVSGFLFFKKHEDYFIEKI